jgi:hypothetical protein
MRVVKGGTGSAGTPSLSSCFGWDAAEVCWACVVCVSGDEEETKVGVVVWNSGGCSDNANEGYTILWFGYSMLLVFANVSGG